MQEQPIVADEKQDAVTRLCLTVAAVDGIVILVLVIIPLLVLGRDAYTGQMMIFMIPLALGMAISGAYFLYGMQQIGKI
jgi:hypothetical protein